MGLDMYLEKRTYVKNWDYMQPEERHEVTVKKGGVVLPKSVIDPARVKEIIEEVGYWRKANAIHAWFVANVQDGENDCEEHYVDQEQLQELLNLVEKVLADHSKAEALLPTQSGFFFGSTEYDIEKVLADHSKAEALLPTQSGFFFGSTEYDKYYFSDLEETKKILTEALEDTAAEYYYHSSW